MNFDVGLPACAPTHGRRCLEPAAELPAGTSLAAGPLASPPRVRCPRDPGNSIQRTQGDSSAPRVLVATPNDPANGDATCWGQEQKIDAMLDNWKFESRSRSGSESDAYWACMRQVVESHPDAETIVDHDIAGASNGWDAFDAEGEITACQALLPYDPGGL